MCYQCCELLRFIVSEVNAWNVYIYVCRSPHKVSVIFNFTLVWMNWPVLVEFPSIRSNENLFSHYQFVSCVEVDSVVLLGAPIDCKHAEMCRFQTSCMWHCAFGQIVPIVLKDHSAFILRVKQSALYASTASPWMWWHRMPLTTLGSTVQVTQSHIPEDMNLQLYHCGNFKLSVLENTLFQFIFLRKERFCLNLTSFYLENKLFHNCIG